MAQRVVVQDTAADADALAGTLLEFAPGPGLMRFWQASTVNTATVSLDVGDDAIVRSQVIPLRTNGVPSLADDPSIDVPVAGGEKNLVNIGGTTGTVHTVVEHIPLDEL